MDLTYTWNFVRFNVYNNLNSLDKVIYSIDWCLSASDGAGHGDQVYGSTSLSEPDVLSFTPFEQLTQPQVQTWVIESLGDQLADYQAILQNKIQAQITPTTQVLGQPW